MVRPSNAVLRGMRWQCRSARRSIQSLLLSARWVDCPAGVFVKSFSLTYCQPLGRGMVGMMGMVEEGAGLTGCFSAAVTICFGAAAAGAFFAVCTTDFLAGAGGVEAVSPQPASNANAAGVSTVRSNLRMMVPFGNGIKRANSHKHLVERADSAIASTHALSMAGVYGEGTFRSRHFSS